VFWRLKINKASHKKAWNGKVKGRGGDEMAKRKKDPSKTELGSPEVEGQGTTVTETGEKSLDSARKKQKK
jgi:YuzL-like protein